MTRYSVDSDVRLKAVLVVACISIAIAIGANVWAVPCVKGAFYVAGLGALYDTLNDTGILGGAGTLGLYGGLWALFDSILWKWGPIASCHGIPNLNGTWDGKGTSSYVVDGEHVEYGMRLEVTQTFSKMECKSKFASSESSSHIIGIHGCNPKRRSCTLEFSYQNEAHVESVEHEGWDNDHRGFNWIECDGDNMTGHYFTNRKEPTNGVFSLKRTSKRVAEHD